ncbi:hypothetical protein Hdeb2414_s0018g00520051 [Helianthus debilis subsp. tardiflorus]
MEMSLLISSPISAGQASSSQRTQGRTSLIDSESFKHYYPLFLCGTWQKSRDCCLVRFDLVQFDSVRFGSSPMSRHSLVVRPRV